MRFFHYIKKQKSYKLTKKLVRLCVFDSKALDSASMFHNRLFMRFTRDKGKSLFKFYIRVSLRQVS